MAGDGFIYNTRRKMQVVVAKIFPMKFVNKVYTKIHCGYVPDLKNPKTFNEKVQWLKFNNYSDNIDVINMADKVKVREVLKEKGFDHLLPEMYFSCDKVEEILWDKLPSKFVIKCNHGCAYNIVCNDKETFDKNSANKKLNTWLKQDFGLYNLELHYSKIQKKIFAEEHLGDNLIDYKFFCFNGQPQFLYISKDLIHDSTAEIVYYDMEWNRIPLVRDDYKLLENVDKPACFDELVYYAKELSKDFPLVRVDFYVINDKPIFSEMTFTPSAGMMPITPREYDKKWGELLDISHLQENVK